jgi:hypothetical protein
MGRTRNELLKDVVKNSLEQATYEAQFSAGSYYYNQYRKVLLELPNNEFNNIYKNAKKHKLQDRKDICDTLDKIFEPIVEKSKKSIEESEKRIERSRNKIKRRR